MAAAETSVSGSVPYLLWSNYTDCLALNVIGVLLSAYSYYVEVNKEQNPNYRAMCDIHDSYMSCSKVLTSKYSVGFGFMHLILGKNHAMNARNCNMGLVLYSFNICTLLLLPKAIASAILFYSSAISVLGCVYLAFVLFFILKDVCLVCISMYAVNGALLYITHAMRSASHL